MNVYQIITDRIVELLDRGVVPWRKSWTVETPKNLVSGREYRGVNVLLLSSMPFASNYWLTYRQAADLGGFVRKGERGCPVVFWKIWDRESDAGKVGKGFLLRYYTVFNVEQCQGIEVPTSLPRRSFDAIEECERIVASYPNPPRVEHGGSVACYVPSADRVQMPPQEAFESGADYYSCLFHEFVHSTGAKHRLARSSMAEPVAFGSHTYSKEELVAEVGAAFLAAHGGIAPSVLPNAASYIEFWSRKLRSEPRWIVDAAAQASKAADLIMGKIATASEPEATEEAA